ncbi:hypothetical protein B296_00036987 [Ensete ventricosum]|uniref:Endonuclease/exonuclease/phosphatase domain-containing protein n=1 Tax=Ensete ventricosum TaxID=4639 RepID=A0A426YFB6_ENSVE|nr:hypothetical protein B296_00036987 [Ensete ventricosum]
MISERSVSCTTFNIFAPIYKRLSEKEVWLGNEELVDMYEKRLGDAGYWVSHRNHRGNICGVDFIWLLNPNMYRKPLRTSWSEAVFGIIKKRIWSLKWSEHPNEILGQGAERGSATSIGKHQAFGFSVKDAVLFPPEVEKGTWPEDYSLSDHAPLTVVFSPVRMSYNPS